MLHPIYRGPMVDYTKKRKHLIYKKGASKSMEKLHPEAERLLLFSDDDYEALKKQLEPYGRLGCRVSY